MKGDTGSSFRLSPAAIRAGAAVFAAASLAGLLALFLISRDLSGSLAGFRRFSLAWLPVCLGLVVAEWAGAGLRLWLLLRPIGLRIRYPACVRIAAASTAMAYITPSGTGGGPAQLYGVLRSGASLGRAVAANFATLIVNLLFLSAAGISAWALGAASEIETIRLPVADISAARLFEYAALGFGSVAAVVLLIAASPRLPRLVIVRAFGRGPRVRSALKFLHELHGSIRIYGARGKTTLVLAVLVDAIPFGARFLMGWAVLRGFGIDAGFWNVVILHVLLHFLIYFMPTPGGAGVAEVLAAALMSPFLPSSLLVAYTAAWRFFLAWVTIGAGGAVVFGWLRADARRALARVAGADAGAADGGGGGGAEGGTGGRSPG
ncbi:MAG: lysylphosphatidylglycerol synthase transmembrane domain-containing protein [Gemmatimonadota bacterium]|nr:lysylphosphatidylglycerol synthase transmembrane domain-containing protein [Gemmatimonadota bacterium]